MADNGIATVENELRHAEEDLSEALQEVSHKVQVPFNLASWIRQWPLSAASSAAVLSFVIGMSTKLVGLLPPLMLGTMVGLSLRGSNSENRGVTNGTARATT
jgi:hypothetical protein